MTTLASIRAALAAGTATSQSCIDDAYRAAQRSQDALRAFCYLPPQAPVGNPRATAPLAGVAVGIKDMIDTAEMVTAFNSPAYQGRRPQQDAWVVARLRAAGATVLGKTVTTEFAWRHPGPTVNPWNPAYTPGGSSSGSAAAVAAGIVPLAFGTQTQGSVVRPAAYCGVIGFKPTYGTIPRTGVLPLAGSLDHVGLFTSTVADAAYTLRVVRGSDLADPHRAHVPQGPARPAAHRIGIVARQVGGTIDAAQQALLDGLAAKLAADGAQLVQVELPAELFDAAGYALQLMSVEAAITHGALVDRSPELVSPAMRDLVRQGRALDATAYAHARATQGPMAHRFQAWLTQTMALDALLVAPASGEPPRGLESTGDAAFCAPWSYIGVPALNLPAGLGPSGLPLGVQLVGPAHGDEALLELAAWVEARTGWNQRRPPLAWAQ